jgi:hypothetical protein
MAPLSVSWLQMGQRPWSWHSSQTIAMQFQQISSRQSQLVSQIEHSIMVDIPL